MQTKLLSRIERVARPQLDVFYVRDLGWTVVHRNDDIHKDVVVRKRNGDELKIEEKVRANKTFAKWADILIEIYEGLPFAPPEGHGGWPFYTDPDVVNIALMDGAERLHTCLFLDWRQFKPWYFAKYLIGDGRRGEYRVSNKGHRGTTLNLVLPLEAIPRPLYRMHTVRGVDDAA